MYLDDLCCSYKTYYRLFLKYDLKNNIYILVPICTKNVLPYFCNFKLLITVCIVCLILTRRPFTDIIFSIVNSSLYV